MSRRGGWLGAGLAAALAAALAPQAAEASEGGASVYLLGSGGPGAANMPPLQGVFFDNMAYFYSGDGGGGAQLPYGGNLVAGVHGSIPADFATVLWVPTTDFAGGTLALGGALPFGNVNVHADAFITGPLGNTIGVPIKDSANVIGDPILTGMLGWKVGPRSNLQLSTTLNVPIGEYRSGELANLAFHRWADDLSLAYTFFDKTTGWDLSAKAGVTFNGTNEADHYTTGTESHYELSVGRTFNPVLSAALQAYYFYQLTGDSGAGAKLGAFKGEVAGVGGTVAWNVKAGKIPLSVRVRGMHEFNARNRLEGDSLWLDLTMPLYVKLPPGAARE